MPDIDSPEIRDGITAATNAWDNAEEIKGSWHNALDNRNTAIRRLSERGLSAGQISKALDGRLTKSGVRFILKTP